MTRFEEMLLARSKVSVDDLRKVHRVQQERGGEPLERLLVELGFMSEDDLLVLLAEYYHAPIVNARDFPREPPAIANINPGFFRQARLCPLAVQDGQLSVAMADPGDLYVIEAVEKATNLRLTLHLARERDILDTLNTYYADGAGEERAAGSEVGEVEYLEEDQEDVEHLPQDGRIKLRMLGREIDLRVSTLPTLYGESVVLRILDRASIVVSLDSLGFPTDTLTAFDKLINRPYGMILVTGPTGSGKTTSLYGALDKINSPDKKIITIEDPVEYQLRGVNQIHVKPQIGLTFANGLRSIVRQDPDVIMVGEIRDYETAEISVQAALTGHLVFSTLHTNDAGGAVSRLLEMGVEDYLLASSLLGIMAQRLVRTLCRHCRRPAEVGVQREENGTSTNSLDAIPTAAYEAQGCEECAMTGYRGRSGIFELLLMNEGARQLILKHASAEAIKNFAVSQGMRTLREDGWRKVREGTTTVAEVLRVTQDE